MKKYGLTLLLFCIPVVILAQGGGIVSTDSSDTKDLRREELLESLLSLGGLTTFRSSLSQVNIDTTQIEPRGKMSGRRIILSSHIQKESEFVKLFVHELAHVVDIYFFSAKNGSDLSEIFYQISWENVQVKKPLQKMSSFVSGYASTNRYEDFAESFVFYVFHNQEFHDRALRDDSLRQKYLFFAQYVFPKGEFGGTDFSLGTIPSYSWDTTKIPILLQKYLYSLHGGI